MSSSTDQRTLSPLWVRIAGPSWFVGIGLVTAALLLSACYFPLSMVGMQPDLSLLESPTRNGRSGVRRVDRSVTKDKGPLGLNDIVFHLLVRTQRLKVLRLRKKALEAQHATGGGIRNPELRIMNISSAIADQGSGGLGIRLRWSPPFPGAIRARGVRAVALARAGAQRLGLSVYKILARARELHARLTFIDLRIAARQRLLEIRRQRLQFHRKQVQAGLVSLLKADLARLSELDEKQQLSILAMRRTELVGRLCSLLELRPGQRISTAIGSTGRWPVLPARRTIVTQTLGRHPALAELAELARARHASLYLAKTKRYPWIDFVQAAYDFGENKLEHRFQFGVGIRLPLFHRNTAKIQLQHKRVALLKARKEALRRSLASEVEARLRTARVAHEVVARYRKVTQPRLRRILARAKVATQQQGVNLDEVFRIRAMVVRFDLAHLQQQLRYNLARIRLDLATVAPVWRAMGIQLADK